MRRALVSAAVATLSLGGCAHWRRPPAADPYTCRPGPRPQVVATVPETRVAAGRFAVKVLAPMGTGKEEGEETVSVAADVRRRLSKVHLQVQAEAIPLHLFASRLAEVLQVAVMTDPRVADVRVSIWADDISFDQLITLLDKTESVWLEVSPFDHDGQRFALVFVSNETRETFGAERRGGVRELPVQFLPTRSGRARQIANALCEHLVVSAGAAVSVVGDTLIVKDLADNMGKLRAAVEFLDKGAPEREPEVPAPPRPAAADAEK